MARRVAICTRTKKRKSFVHLPEHPSNARDHSLSFYRNNQPHSKSRSSLGACRGCTRNCLAWIHSIDRKKLDKRELLGSGIITDDHEGHAPRRNESVLRWYPAFSISGSTIVFLWSSWKERVSRIRTGSAPLNQEEVRSQLLQIILAARTGSAISWRHEALQ